MTQEEKQLLLRDLCARLPYGVLCKVKKYRPNIPQKLVTIIPSYTDPCIQVATYLYKPEEIQPYLRQMSSMTEKEFNELATTTELQYDQLELMDWGNDKTLEFYLSEVPQYCVIKVFDWLNAHYFDYRGLISMGLALEATKDMYDTKTE